MHKTYLAIALFLAIAVSACTGKTSTSTAQSMEGLDSLPPDIQNLVKSVVMSDSDSFASMVLYPLQRTYPLHNIEDEEQMLDYYHVIMDDTLKAAITNNPGAAWHEFGWRGWSVSDGSYIWYSDGIYAIPYMSAQEIATRQALVKAEMQSLAPSLRKGWEPVGCYKAVESDSIFRIDKQIKPDGATSYRLAGYSSPSQMRDMPSVLLFGYRTVEGSAMIETYDFSDKSGITMSITPDMTDDDGNPELTLTAPSGSEKNITVSPAYWLDLLPKK